MSETDTTLSFSSEETKRLYDESKAAIKIYEQATRLVGVLTRDEPHGSSPWLATFAELKALVPPGVYLLHKSTKEQPKLYTVLGVGDHTERKGEFLVTCIAHYAPHKGNLCYRPLLGEGGFLTPVPKGELQPQLGIEYSIPRFKYVAQLPLSFEHFVELSTG